MSSDGQWTPHELAEEAGGHWAEHDKFPSRDWRYEVADGDTRLGYWEWVAAQLNDTAEEDEDE